MIAILCYSIVFILFWLTSGHIKPVSVELA